jgi:hypothetical protein
MVSRPLLCISDRPFRAAGSIVCFLSQPRALPWAILSRPFGAKTRFYFALFVFSNSAVEMYFTVVKSAIITIR